MSQPTLHHDVQGRFTSGNPGGPGNPFHRHSANLRKAFVEAFTPDDLVKVASKVFYSAMRGNMTAARMVLQYCIGKPGPAVDPDRVEGRENHGEHRGHGERQEEKIEAAGTVATEITVVKEPRGHGGHGERQESMNGEAGTVETVKTGERAPRGHGERQESMNGEAGTDATVKKVGRDSPADSWETVENGLLLTANGNRT